MLSIKCLNPFYLTNNLIGITYLWTKNVYNSQLMLTLFDLAKN